MLRNATVDLEIKRYPELKRKTKKETGKHTYTGVLRASRAGSPVCFDFVVVSIYV